MIDVEIVDPHHHLCHLAQGYPWLEGPPQRRYHGDDLPLRRDYLVADYRADFAGLPLVASVHVENGAADPLWEAQWIDDLCGSGIPQAQVAKVDLSAPDAARRLEEVAAIPSVHGIRDILNWHPDPVYTHRDRPDLMADPQWLQGFSRLAAAGLSFDLQVFADQLPQAAHLAAAHPDVRIILDHTGMPVARDPEYLARWRAGLRAVAACSNTVVKVSALGTTDHQWTVDSLRPIILDTIDIFGCERAMFASNFPVDGLYSSLAELYAAYDEITQDFTTAERAALFAGTARTAYRLT